MCSACILSTPDADAALFFAPSAFLPPLPPITHLLANDCLTVCVSTITSLQVSKASSRVVSSSRCRTGGRPGMWPSDCWLGCSTGRSERHAVLCCAVLWAAAGTSAAAAAAAAGHVSMVQQAKQSNHVCCVTRPLAKKVCSCVSAFDQQ